MKRRKFSIGKVLKALRTVEELGQLQVAVRMPADQSTVSRIESSLWITPAVVDSYVEACGGWDVVERLIKFLQSLVNWRQTDNYWPLKPA